MPISMKQWSKWTFDGGDAWTNWTPFSGDTVAGIRAAPGAYVLGLPTERAPLGRLLAGDPHALLDIGESSDLRRRLGDLLRCMSKKEERGHMAGWRLGSGGLMERLKMQPKEFCISVCYANPATRDEAYRIEGTLLRAYYELFGELPPLNYKFNWAAWEDSD